MSLLNVDAALRNLGNNRKLYKKVLDKFTSAYETADIELRSHIIAEEYEEAERLAHTIKGLAGSVGAEVLSSASATLEQACKAKTGTAIEAALDEFAVALGAAICACKTTSATME